MCLSRNGLSHTVKKLRRERKLKVKLVSDLFWGAISGKRAFSGLKCGAIRVL